MDLEHSERHVYKDRDPDLFGRIEKLLLTSNNKVEIDGLAYVAAQDKDEDGTDFYILVPAG